MAPDILPLSDGQLLTGHVAEWGELLGVLSDQRGLTVMVADPLSGASALLAGALLESDHRHVLVDARRCSDSLDLAMAVADAAFAALTPDAAGWWSGSAPLASTAGLRVWRSLSASGVDIDDLRLGVGPGAERLGDALRLVVALADGPVTLAVDHLGPMLAGVRAVHARAILGEFRAARQRAEDLDLLLVDHPGGPVSAALGNAEHPMYRAGERFPLRRPTPARIVDDLIMTKSLVDTPVALLGTAAELAAGVPSLTWQVVAMAPRGPEDASRAVAGWQALRRAAATSVRRQWDLLRHLHPSAQALVAAIALGLPPHSVPVANQTVRNGLARLRDAGLAWQPAARAWAVSDPLLAAYAREHAPPWAQRRSQFARIAAAGQPLRPSPMQGETHGSRGSNR